MKDKHKNKCLVRLSRLNHSPLLVLFCVLLFGMFAIDLASPDKAISEMENTKLDQRPSLAIEKLFSSKGTATLNNYFKDYNEYTKDQVAFRDSLISAHSFAETALFQKTTHGGILLGDNDMMFPRTYSLLPIEETTFAKNLAAIATFSEAYPGKISMLIAPTASNIYPENVPNNAPLLNTGALLDETYAAAKAAGINTIDVRDTLSAHKDEYIYYRTDHHWTTKGAYYAYEAFCENKGMTPFAIDSAPVETVEDFHGTHFAKARTWNAVPDTITYYPMENPLTIYRVLGKDKVEVETTTTIYETEKFDTFDKYSAFMHGNPGYARIEGNGEGSILILKDSYANSFIPYLTENYATIDVLDYRNYAYGLDSLIEKNQYDDILILYNIDSFKSDAKLQRITVRG